MKRVSCSQTAQTASQAFPYMHMQKDAREVRRDVEEISQRVVDSEHYTYRERVVVYSHVIIFFLPPIFHMHM